MILMNGKTIKAWTGGVPIDDFIASSKKSRSEGDFITHRENGISVDLNTTTMRAIGKMKATISQRFSTPNPSNPTEPIEYDIDCDVRFIMWCIKMPLPTPKLGSPGHYSPTPGTGLGPRSGSGGWKVQFVKLFYEKDRVVPVDGKNVPTFGKEELDAFPYGYRHLGAAQARVGREVRKDLATLKEDDKFYGMYRAMDGWLNGEDVRGVLGI